MLKSYHIKDGLTIKESEIPDTVFIQVHGWKEIALTREEFREMASLAEYKYVGGDCIAWATAPEPYPYPYPSPPTTVTATDTAPAPAPIENKDDE